MSLKDLLNMTKTDRYTADGRDELVKLQKEITEDVTYKTGDISQKTGLQKQPDGSWAPPKKGGPGAGNEYYKNDVRTEAGEKKILSETKTEVLQSKIKDLEETKRKNGGKLGVYGEKSLQLAKEELAKRSNPATEGLESKSTEELTNLFNELATKSVREKSPENSAERDRVYKELKRRQKTESKTQKDPKEIIATPGKLATQEQTDAATAIADKNSYSFETMMEKFPIQKIQQFANSKVDDFEGGIDEYIEFKAEGRTGVDMEEVGKDFAKLINHNVARRIWNGYTNGSLKVDEKGFFKPAASIDSAPRILTGDTKIRVRK